MYEDRVRETMMRNPSGLVEEQKAARPFGVSILAGLNMFGAFLVVASAFAIGFSQGGTGTAIAFGLLGLGQFLVARGLWHLRNWARLIAIGAYSISAGLGLIALFLGNPLGILQMLVAGSIAYYLTREHVVYVFTN